VTTEQPSGFTVVPDWIVAEHGIAAALVYGVIWRYCQMRKGVCFASLTALGEKVGMTRQCFARHLQTLLDNGLVVDRTPEAKGKTHEYVVVTPGAVAAEPVTNDDLLQAETPPVTQHNNTCCTALQPPVTPRNTNNTIEDTNNIPPEDQSPPAAARAPTPPLAVTFQGVLSRLRKARNMTAELRSVYQLCFEGEPPDFGYLGKAAKAVGGAGRLAELMWQLTAKPPTGDVLAYILATQKGQISCAAPDRTVETRQPKFIAKRKIRVLHPLTGEYIETEANW